MMKITENVQKMHYDNGLKYTFKKNGNIVVFQSTDVSFT